LSEGGEARGDWGWSAPVERVLAGVVLAAALGLAVQGAAARRAPAAPLPALRLDVNRVDAALLAVLPGVGPGRARAIESARRERPFESLGDLDRRVPGLGARTAEGLAPFVRFPEPPLAARD
jgi:competence protein ComEA